ncbi:hypothetical protein D3C72_2116500 [compost metagenome]
MRAGAASSICGFASYKWTVAPARANTTAQPIPTRPVPTMATAPPRSTSAADFIGVLRDQAARLRNMRPSHVTKLANSPGPARRWLDTAAGAG